MMHYIHYKKKSQQKFRGLSSFFPVSRDLPIPSFEFIIYDHSLQPTRLILVNKLTILTGRLGSTDNYSLDND